jgi:hypothetical protein
VQAVKKLFLTNLFVSPRSIEVVKKSRRIKPDTLGSISDVGKVNI